MYDAKPGIISGLVTKISAVASTTTPYLFLHTPDIAQAPELDIPCGKTYVKRFQRSEQFRLSTAIFSFLNLPPIIDRCHRPFKGSLYGKRAVCRFKCVVIMKFSFDVVRLRMQYRVAYGDAVLANCKALFAFMVTRWNIFHRDCADAVYGNEWRRNLDGDICGIVLLAGRLMHYYGFHHVCSAGDVPA